MESRRKISAALMLTYLFAMALNAFVVLTCDCTSCHSHTTHKCPCEMCLSCEEEAYLSQHCDCTHSHEILTEVAVAADSERSLKLIKIAIAELPRTIADSVDSTSMFEHETPIVPLSVPLGSIPVLSTGGLRAPPVFA